MDNSQNTTKSSAGSSRWLPMTAGTLRQDRSNHKAAGPNFRRLFELAPNAMVLADSPGRIVLVNAQTEQLFGYERDELIGERVEMLMPERFRQSYFGHRSAYLMEPRLRPIGAGLELYGLRKDGSEFPIEISLSPLESEVGMLVSTAIRDLSQRKQMEELRTELGFEKLLSELSETFINIPPAVVDGEIENGLRRIVEWYGTDRAALAEVDIATGILIVTHRWDRPGIPPNPERVVKEMFPWLYERILKGEMVCVSRPEQLPEEAGLELEFMNSVGMKSTLNIPLLIGGKLIGALATASFHKHIKWDAALISRFQQVGNVFANALSRKHDDERLQAAYKQISELKERLEQENVYLREEIKLEHDHTAVIGHSDAIRSVLKKAEQVASTDSAVLILGETGTGKELIARTIHELSKRKDHPMVKVNCAAMPATLIESELFGREKGAYTGALSREIGRFELAHHSTIFLDEIGEMPIELQAKLLRVLQDGEFERLGSSKTVHVDVRVIAATNRDLREAVKDGKFREDLFYRLNVFPIQIPPLRERQEDIPALVRHILKNQCKRMGREVESIQPATLKAFEAYSWPGNVRELSNVIERHLILNPGPVFHAEVPESDEVCVPAGQNLEEIERRHMQQVLQNTRWRIRGKGGAAETLGLKPTTLEARMKKLGIVRPQ
jgi:formate hydrogenlyase transcriptional activator